MNEAEVLFTEILSCDRISLYLNRGLPLDKAKSLFVAEVLKRRLKGEPLPYILGKTEFMGLQFMLTPGVFIPRPETEILVETVIDIVKLLNCYTVKLLDIGTGSGCIAVSLAKFIPQAEITATDISEKALDVARINAELNNVKVNFMLSDLFNAYSLKLTTYSLILSNSPYIPALEIDTLYPELNQEPRIALDAGEDGLDFYRKLSVQAHRYLTDDGYLIMEMGFGQREAVERIFKESGNFQIREIVRDYINIERVMVAQRKKEISEKV